MATTYDSTLPTAKDRIRRMIGDRRSPWRFDDEEIVATLAEYGSDAQSEIRAAIALLEEETTTVSESKKQGSWSRSRTVSADNRSRIEALRARLVALDATGAVSPVGIADSDFPEPEPFPIYREAGF